MRMPITSDSLTGQPGVGSAPSPEVDTVQHRAEDALEKRLAADSICDHAPHESSNPIPLNTSIRRHKTVGICGACGRHLMPKVDPGDDSARDEPGVLSSPQEEELPELLDFSINIEQMLASGDSLQQDRPKGKLLKFEVPEHMRAVPPVKLVDSSNSMGTAAKVIEFRRLEGKRTFPGNQNS